MYGFQQSQSMLPLGTLAYGLLARPCWATQDDEKTDPRETASPEFDGDEYQIVGGWNSQTKEFILAPCISCFGTGIRKKQAGDSCAARYCVEADNGIKKRLTRKRKCEKCRCHNCYSGPRFGSTGGAIRQDSELYRESQRTNEHEENRNIEKNFGVMRTFSKPKIPRVEELWVDQNLSVIIDGEEQAAKIVHIKAHTINVQLIGSNSQITVNPEQLRVKEQLEHQTFLRNMSILFEKHFRDYYPFTEKPKYVFRYTVAQTVQKSKGMGYGSVCMRYLLQQVQKLLKNGEKAIIMAESDCREDHEYAMKRVNWFCSFGFKVRKDEYDANCNYIFNVNRGGGSPANRIGIKKVEGVWNWEIVGPDNNTTISQTIPEEQRNAFQADIDKARESAGVHLGGCNTGKSFERACPGFYPEGSTKYFQYTCARGSLFVNSYLEITKDTPLRFTNKYLVLYDLRASFEKALKNKACVRIYPSEKTLVIEPTENAMSLEEVLKLVEKVAPQDASITIAECVTVQLK